MYDIVIIGAGPAGLTAATYSLRAGKTVLVIEKSGFGGQVAFSPKIENFPGIVSVRAANSPKDLLNSRLNWAPKPHSARSRAYTALPAASQ